MQHIIHIFRAMEQANKLEHTGRFLGTSESSLAGSPPSSESLWSALRDPFVRVRDRVRDSLVSIAFANACTSSVIWIRLKQEKRQISVPSSCASSLLSLIALACSMLIRPVIPSSARISLSFLICSCGVSRPWKTFDHTFLTPQARTRDWLWSEVRPTSDKRKPGVPSIAWLSPRLCYRLDHLFFPYSWTLSLPPTLIASEGRPVTSVLAYLIHRFGFLLSFGGFVIEYWKFRFALSAGLNSEWDTTFV